ncbi:hypothetical protein E2562_005617 [Oryza meyeriana var. granulata]|uniref:Uncharacterized protein n=1 Tax=Oryza meyeriana var. granulata TaxID=110450 RepID=A0A6G1F4C0_9ORYZ|nr:hypothetical protein E2562_005617 [Oryza meyeriana var. granulata]
MTSSDHGDDESRSPPSMATASAGLQPWKVAIQIHRADRKMKQIERISTASIESSTPLAPCGPRCPPKPAQLCPRHPLQSARRRLCMPSTRMGASIEQRPESCMPELDLTDWPVSCMPAVDPRLQAQHDSGNAK